MSARPRILELDGLRTFAVFAVMVFHFFPHFHTELGWMGVDLFFVISGFLITGILWDLRSDPAPFRKFYWRRVIRIFPPYYAVVALVAILALSQHDLGTRSEWLAALFFLPAVKGGISLHLLLMRLTRHARFDFASSPYTAFSASRYIDGLGPYWSLEVEELFYLLWAPVILKCPRRIIMAFAIAPLFICPVLRGLVHTANAYEYGGFLPRFDTLAVGGCLALLLRAKPDLPKWVLPCSVSLALAGLLGLCTHCGLFRGVEVRSTELFSVVGYSLLALLFGCVVGSCVQWEKHAVLAPLRLRPVVYIGTISYTMYLTHVLIFAAALRIFGQGSLPGTVAIALTVGVAALSWKYFETPILRLRNWPERARRGAEKHFTAVAD